MPKSRTAPGPHTPRDSTELKSPVLVVRDAADALYRAAAECHHQHDRASRVHAKATSEEEVAAAQRSCRDCDEMLRELVGVYEQTAASVVPVGDDQAWWHRANALWLASREYLRRTGGCETESKNLKDHSPERLSELHTEYELEASALLALKHAADAYRQLRPAAA